MNKATNNPMLNLFRIEVETHCNTIHDGLKTFDDENGNTESIKLLATAAHSIMGAAKMVKLNSAKDTAKAIEDILTAVQRREIRLDPANTGTILSATNHLHNMTLASDTELGSWGNDHKEEIEKIRSAFSTILSNKKKEKPAPKQTTEKNSDSPKTSGIPRIQPTTSVDESMLDLFRIEVETHSETLNTSLLELEENPADTDNLEALMRAAHSIKGAARMVGVNAVVALAHIMEDGFTAAQSGEITLEPTHIDILLAGVDLLNQISLLSAEEHLVWPDQNHAAIEELLVSIKQIVDGEVVTTKPEPPLNSKTTRKKVEKETETPKKPDISGASITSTNNNVRVSADRINRLIGLSGEFMVASGWVNTYSDTLLAIKKQQTELFTTIEKLRINMEASNDSDNASMALITEALQKADTCGQSLTDSLSELDEFDRRTEILSGRLNHEVISSRMRPFKEGVQGFQRMIRDVSRSLDKKINFKITGENTQVDRDILQKIEAPLNHILRNSIDHGIESPEERINSGKPESGTIHLEAFHNAGMLSIIVSDDGRGVNLDNLRKKILEKGMVNEEMAGNLSESELLDFLFLPGFSTKGEVTEISGRGVGLDVVHTTIQEVRGQIRSSSTFGKGLRIHLQLPLTLSVIRCLMVEISGEPYAFPLARIHNIVSLNKNEIETMENLQYFTDQGDHIGLINASQIFGTEQTVNKNDKCEIVVIGDRHKRYGLVINRFLGEHNLVVHTLDPRLGRIKDISAAAITDEGVPTLIINVDDILISIEELVTNKRLHKVKNSGEDRNNPSRKSILVVDDSLTVREVERKLLESKGYQVEMAIDGMDGWNTVRTGRYDLVISDVDMPRMNGIEFVSMIKQDPNLKTIPVMIVSYKDRQEDRELGLDAGADYYLTKGSFHDESLIDAVVDLIGEAD